jgi:hypothetical protein
MATNISKLAIILDKAINKDVKNAGAAAAAENPPQPRGPAEEARAGEWLAILEPILDVEYPDWRTVHNYPA